MNAGLNGNYHPEHVHDTEGALSDLGVTYHGDGNWDLPEGARIDTMGGDDWVLTLADGAQYRVCTDD